MGGEGGGEGRGYIQPRFLSRSVWGGYVLTWLCPGGGAGHTVLVLPGVVRAALGLLVGGGGGGDRGAPSAG